MRRFMLSAMVGLVVAPSLALGQAPTARAIPTRYDPVAESMEALLDQGFQIVTVTMNAFILVKDGGHILCQLTPPNPMLETTQTTSTCQRLNG